MKEKFESAKEFVVNHKTDFICGGILLGCLAAIAVVQVSVKSQDEDDESVEPDDAGTDINDITEE